MKPTLAHQSAGLIAGCLVLASCATPTLTLEETKAYAGQTVEQFVAARFGSGKLPNEEGGFVYTAYFTEANPRQLYRPTQEMINFCRIQGGSPIRTHKYEGDPVAMTFLELNLEAFAAYSRTLQQTGSPSAALHAGANTARAAQRITRYVEGNSAMKAFKFANDGGLYGRFECRTDKAKPDKMWAASIAPLGFISKQAGNDISAHKLVIELRLL